MHRVRQLQGSSEDPFSCCDSGMLPKGWVFVEGFPSLPLLGIFGPSLLIRDPFSSTRRPEVKSFPDPRISRPSFRRQSTGKLTCSAKQAAKTTTVARIVAFTFAKRTRSRRPRDQKWDRKLTKKRFNRGPNFAISSSKRPFSVCAQCTNFATELCLGILSNHTTYFDEILQYRAPPCCSLPFSLLWPIESIEH